MSSFMCVDPRDERVEVVLRELRLAHAVHDDAVTVLVGVEPPAAARDDVDLVAVADELLGQLAHVPREAALDDRRVLPRQASESARCGTLSPMPLRPARAADAPAVTAVFQAARQASLPYLPILHSSEEDNAYFARVVAAGGVTVAELDGEVVAFLALGERVDHLYVHPDHYRQGLGSALLRHAQATRPQLELWVFQRNSEAIAFYEAHGFAIVKATEGANNQEKEPDYLMAWHTIA